jgi:hypothetical protein
VAEIVDKLESESARIENERSGGMGPGLFPRVIRGILKYLVEQLISLMPFEGCQRYCCIYGKDK